MNKFSSFLSTFLALFLIMMGVFLSKINAQVLNWSSEDILTDTYQSGANPDMFIDQSGDIHISYWDKERSRLMYGFRDKSDGTWAISPIPGNSPDGFASSIIVEAGVVHIAYIVNQSDSAFLAYATNAGGTWTTEFVDHPNIGVYGTDLVSPSFIQHSLDLTIQPNGEPAILFFDARIYSLTNCSAPIREMYLNYELDMNLALKQANGEWNIYLFDDVPDLSGFNCIQKGDRFGEFCRIIRGAGGKYHAITNSLHNHDLLLYTSAPGDLTSWTLSRVDSSESYFATSVSVFKEGFSFIDAKLSSDTLLHFAYGMASFYGYASSIPNRLPFFYRNVNPDSVDQVNYSGVSKRFVPNSVYRSYFSIATPTSDNIFLSYMSPNENTLVVGNSTDGGQTWVHDSIMSVTTNAQTRSEYYGDSVFVAVYDAEKDVVRLVSKSITGNSWREESATISQESGKTLGSQIIRNGNDDEIYLAYSEGLSEQVFFGSRINGTWNHELISSPGEIGDNATLNMYQSSVPVIIYVDKELSELKSTFKAGNNWHSNIISASDEPRDVVVGSYLDTIYVAYFDLSKGEFKVAKAGSPSGPWEITVLDSTSSIVGRNPSMTFDNQGTIHISYVDVLNSILKYASRPIGGMWNIESTATSFSYIPANSSIKTTSKDLPIIAFRNSANSTMWVAEKDSLGVWGFSEIQGDGTNQAGAPLRLIIDTKDKPWVLYNFVGAKDELRLVRRDKFKNWHQVSVLNNQAEISTQFDFHLVENDFYIIGKKNELGNRGLGILFADEGVFTNINETLIEETFQLYPNPSQGQARVSFSLQQTEIVSLEIYNLSGQRIHSMISDETLLTGDHQFDLNINHLPAGIYICRMKTPSFTVSKKWVIVP